MPEGPEIRRSRDFLSNLLIDHRVIMVSAVGGRYATVPPVGMRELNLHGAVTVESVNCKGKLMTWSMSSGWKLWCTYGMSGQWTTQFDNAHSAVVVTYQDDDHDAQNIYFNDPRHFGTLKFVHDPDDTLTRKKLDTLGPDMLNDPPTLAVFVACLMKNGHKTLAEVLMDQSVVSGVGNYLKAESLYQAQLSPHRVVNSLDADDFARLRAAIIDVMVRSCKLGGATIRTYRNVDGSDGTAQRRFVVYNHKTDPTGNPVVSETTKDKRTTWWCPAVQR